MKEWTVDATLDCLPVITANIDRELESLNCSRKALCQINMAVDELLANVVRYAYAQEPGNVTVQMSFQEATGTVSLTFIDSGVPFDPLKKEDPDVTLDAEHRPVGGLGILMVKKKMDETEYRREENRNVLTIRKCIRGK